MDILMIGFRACYTYLKVKDVAGSATPHKIDYGLLNSLPQIFEENSHCG